MIQKINTTEVLKAKFFTLKGFIGAAMALKKLAIFIIVCILGFTIYRILLNYTFADRNFILGLVGLWFLTAYLTLPRLHRILTNLYLPNYYIGRTRTGEGLLGDPVNLAILGSRQQVIAHMQNSGWKLAENLDYTTTYKMIKATLFGRSYPNAPVSSLYLFGRKQDLAFQQEVGGSTSKRHHIRFWQTPENWYLPGGRKASWMAAATYDEKIGFSVYTFQFTHKIGENIDQERDHVINTLKASCKLVEVETVKHFSTGYHSRNGGGDSIRTDGTMPFVTISCDSCKENDQINLN